MKDKLHTLIYDAVVELFPGFIIKTTTTKDDVKELTTVTDQDVKVTIDAYLNDTIDEDGRSIFYSSAFYNIANGVVIEDRMCRKNEDILKLKQVVKRDVSGGKKSRKNKKYNKSRKNKSRKSKKR
jgi:hypothetical protein